MKRFTVCLATSLLVLGQSAPAKAGPSPRPSCSSESAKQAVAGTVRAFFAALAKDDDAAVRRLTTPGFRAFDVGRRFTGPELSSLIADAHRSGRTIEWNIGPVEARVDCNLAFAAWENKGASGIAPKLEPRAWLESALLVRQGGRWVIDFLHSTPRDPRY